MFGIYFLYACGLISLVQSHNQYPQFQSYPFGTSTNYASVYENQPIIVQPLSSYSQQYTVQNPSATYQTLTQPSIPNQFQDIYLNKILSNPALQAFLDPSTKIYNQNGIEISDHIRPRVTPNVVNNYFIVPSDYLKVNETMIVPKKKTKVRHNGRRSNYNSQVPKQSLNNEQVKDKIQFINNNINSRPKLKDRQGAYTDLTISNQEYNDKSVRNNKFLQQKGFIDDGQSNIYNKQRNNIKKQEQRAFINNNSGPTNENSNLIGPKTKKIKNEYSDDRGRKIKQNRDGYSNIKEIETVKKKKLENSVDKCDEMFDINDECCELDNRNIRNPVNDIQNKDTNTKSSKHQNDFMKNWMNYVKTLMPDQTFESLDFSNLPYSFEHMYQMPSFNFGNQMSSPNKITKKRKQKEQQTEEEPDRSSKNHANQSKKMTVELVPKYVELESTIPKLDKLEKGNDIVETISDIKLEIPSKVQPSHDIHLEEVSPKIIKNNADTELDTKDERSISYQNDIMDYYPDFTKDAIYTTDEDDLYFFHNRHYYNTDDKELNRERRKYERQFDDIDFKRSGRRRYNDIPSFHKYDIKDKTLCDETKFKIPPGLNEPGFQTRKIEMKDRGTDFYTYYVDKNSGSDKIDFKPLEKNENNIETVFARSKVVKYGQQRDANEKAKVNMEQENSNERYRNPFSRDGDTTVVFSKSWN